MSYIRNRSEERTGYQSGSDFSDKTDFQNDFVMCYRLNDTTSKRVNEIKESGYVAHLMTGISWGQYQDYLLGEYDGRSHMDEQQTDRFGNAIVHGYMVPYMVPTISFADYLTEKLKIAVDAGVEAIHVEEPEFWDRAGYSEAFKREYLLYYREPWQAPHTSVDAHYRCAKLKAYLFRRTIDRVASGIKEYAFVKYGKTVRFYVPTHSLLNYTQWKIMSPEGTLADIPAVDGFIAQVWTGTSREKNIYNGILRERTFDTAYLEYGVMQELVRGTGKRMWFLHDPIEDNPIFDWNDYRSNYLKTVAASLLHGEIIHYEICPWPDRIFNGTYPKGAPDAVGIPSDYASLLNGMFQTLGDMETAKNEAVLTAGVLISDTALYQRSYPDSVYGETPEETVGTVLRSDEEMLNGCIDRMKDNTASKEDICHVVESNALPSFYGLALPLLKNGLPVRPVLLDNVSRYTDCLDVYHLLVLSYEYIKPFTPDVNTALASWVRNGNVLVYVGDGSDPFHGIRSWWSKQYDSPAQHLFDVLGLEKEPEDGMYDCGKGKVILYSVNPASLCVSETITGEYRSIIHTASEILGMNWTESNTLSLHRGPYLIAARVAESDCKIESTFTGLYADMFTPDFRIITKKSLSEDENMLLFDFDAIKEESLRIVGTSVRVLSMEEKTDKIEIHIAGASDFRAYMRIRIPAKFMDADVLLDGESVCSEYNRETQTVLLSFDSICGERIIEIK